MDAERLTDRERAARLAAARTAAARAARESYGRLVALLAASTGDLALAEDALADAFERALRVWPDAGVPANPDGWLLTVARNRERDEWRSAARRRTVPWPADDESGAPSALAPTGVRGPGSSAPTHDPLAELDPDRIPDRRLELLFTCAHPAIDASVRTPLMLQAVLGFEAAEIARAFAVPPATMAQRLVRVKRRIRDARIPFAVPDRRAMAERVPPVLEAIYGCAAIDWRGDAGTLAGEAQYLAAVFARLLEHEPEAWGLAALTTLSLARRGADAAGFVPLDEQDPSTWDAGLIATGESALRRAARERVGARGDERVDARRDARGPAPGPGRFELEAAIQAVHCDRRRTGTTDWAALRTLYDALRLVAPSLGAEVARAVVVARLDGPEAGLAELPADASDFQPWWAARADLLADAGRRREAEEAYRRAAELADEADVRAYLAGRAARLEADAQPG
ncbi:DNA-directed RNA polymerase sigma-70 factor [Agromyces luteolus]|uniref:RNA polymerase sigma factor n=1 Tax=Agromyces luteolus TaxID=88373 RepID=UPI0022F2A67E|nr:DUF6596 domain-containing protein [Agromyces luteolus]GLK28672.1 DNA-directed RNA polymerase sigma-70 factor [Agromyces luteolus]